MRILLALVVLGTVAGAWAKDPATGGDRAGKKIATVNPTAVAPPSALLTGQTKATGTAGAAAFLGPTGSSAGGVGRNLLKPTSKHREAGKSSDSLEPFAQWRPALKDLQQDTASAFGVVKDRLEKLTGTRFEQVTAWAARTYKQFTSPPVMTPAAGPYVVDRYMHAPMYLTREGRLKTVTAR